LKHGGGSLTASPVGTRTGVLTAYEEKEKEDRAEEKKELRPKWIWPLLCLGGAAILFFYFNMDYWFLKALAFLLLLPMVNAVIRYVRYLTHKT
jgi:hypothetical protein